MSVRRGYGPSTDLGSRINRLRGGIKKRQGRDKKPAYGGPFLVLNERMTENTLERFRNRPVNVQDLARKTREAPTHWLWCPWMPWQTACRRG